MMPHISFTDAKLQKKIYMTKSFSENTFLNTCISVSYTHLDVYKRQMKYEELFFLELHILKNIKGLTKKLPGHVFSRVGEYFNTFYSHHLQFPLTGAQKRVIREIRADMGSGRQMNRLLQGDVGSGKDVYKRQLTALLSSSYTRAGGVVYCSFATLSSQHLTSTFISALLSLIHIFTTN